MLKKFDLMNIQKSLRAWFVIHFVADMIFGLPLLFMPAQTLALFGFETAETLTARLVGAALIGIGGNSLFMRKKGKEEFKTMLTLKIIWSSAAIIAIVLSIIEKMLPALWAFLSIFIIFNGVWTYHLRNLK